MSRPSELPPAGEVVELSDAEAPDFLDRHRVAILAFLDGKDPVSQKMRARLSLVVAKLAPATSEDGSRPVLGAGVVDVSHHRLVADALGVKSVPMLVVFVEGEVVDRLIGGPPEVVIEDVLRPRLK